MFKKKLALLLSTLLAIGIGGVMPVETKANTINKIFIAENDTSYCTTEDGIRLIMETTGKVTTGTCYSRVAIHGARFLFSEDGTYEGASDIQGNCNVEISKIAEHILEIKYLDGDYKDFSIPMLFQMDNAFAYVTASSGYSIYKNDLIPDWTTSCHAELAIIKDYDPFTYHKTTSSNYSSSSSKNTQSTQEEQKTSDNDTYTYLSKNNIVAQEVKFTDIEVGSTEEKAINDLAKKGIITQVGENFNLTKAQTKEETCTLLAKLLVVDGASKEKLSKETVDKYLDKDSESYAYIATVGSMLEETTLKEVAEAKEMSRELLAQVLKEVTDIKVEDKKTPFVDIEESTYKEALEYCYNAGILIGTTEDTMSPEDAITNGQMLNVLSRLDKELSKEEA